MALESASQRNVRPITTGKSKEGLPEKRRVNIAGLRMFRMFPPLLTDQASSLCLDSLLENLEGPGEEA